MGNTTSCCVSSSPKHRRNNHSRLETYRPEPELSREDTGCNLQHISDRENIDGRSQGIKLTSPLSPSPSSSLLLAVCDPSADLSCSIHTSCELATSVQKDPPIHDRYTNKNHSAAVCFRFLWCMLQISWFLGYRKSRGSLIQLPCHLPQLWSENGGWVWSFSDSLSPSSEGMITTSVQVGAALSPTWGIVWSTLFGLFVAI